jgi:very-short-patch-repair endonuclease
MAEIHTRLEVARKELLDTGLRNTLLNYRLTKARGVEISSVKSSELFQWLALDQKSLTFLPSEKGKDWEQGKQRPHVLPTTHEERVLQSRLLASYYAARTHIEERGSNILYVALGMLHWFEDNSSQRELKAPLLLIPVELERVSAAEKFTVHWDEEDIEPNLSLAAKLKGEFEISLPSPEETDELEVDRYFGSIERAIRGQERWRVARDEIVLGFFSFSKLLMYRDLEPETWCDDENPDANTLIAGFLRDGFEADNSSISEDEYLDGHIAPDALSQVTDVDSSQALAMIDVQQGKNLVIQGPPGTGKSQTITNLIADAVGRGKRVLFVAEKMTALEVVKRRLDKCHLGEACLELHSHSANKKAVLAELKRTLQLGRPKHESFKWSHEQFKRVRDELTAYCSALNTPLLPSGWAPQKLIGELLRARRERGEGTFPKPALTESVLDELRSWSRHTLLAKQQLVERLQAHLAKMGAPSAHPFQHAQLDAILPSDLDDIGSAIREALEAVAGLDHCTQGLAEFMGIACRRVRGDSEVIARAARRALTAPQLDGLNLRTSDWIARLDGIRDVLTAGARHSEIRAQFEAVLIPEAWNENLLSTRQMLNTTGRKWWKWFSSEYRAARRRVLGLCKGEHAADVATQMEIVDRIMDAARLRSAVAEQEAWVSTLFGIQWQGLRSDWPVLKRLTEWVVDLHRDLGEGRLPSGIIDFLAGAPAIEQLKSKVDAVEHAIPVLDRAWPALFDLLKVADAGRGEVTASEFPQQFKMLTAMHGNLESIQDIVHLNNIRDVLQKEGLGWVIGLTMEWPGAGTKLVAHWRSVCLEPLLRHAYAERTALKAANGQAQTSTREKFKELDVLSFSATQMKLATQHYQGLPQLAGHGQVGTLAREFAKKSRHLPIRKLIEGTGRAMQAIKPVFMMSPMSIAAFIPPRALEFDLVIFDEASQVKPVDAFGAILRAKQVVVVGDSKQLPPTSFFDSLVAANDSEETDDDDTGGQNVAADVESILGMATARGLPQRMLRWHYRSRHHSLIALSNQEFYDNRLVVFPSPEPTSRNTGLVFHHLPKTSYDRGRSRTNIKEAEIVAKVVMLHAKTRPHLTLGVAAFSITQADAIRDQVEMLRKLDPSTEYFFSGHQHEPFFVKNLESVQGDERDVILISVGYGRTAEGYLSMAFGALNGQGGERRLNVLITRARVCCEVFSNITHADIDTDRTSSRGVAAFKAFLKYAQTGISDSPDGGLEDADSPFEDEVAKALADAGHKIVKQVGSGGFRIDLAVCDPDNPSRYLLGIECDGATYHSSRSARDRDRLRQQVLEGLGWRIHRIWSADWFQNPREELRRALAAIAQAKLAGANPPPPRTNFDDMLKSTQLERAPLAEEPQSIEISAAPYKVAALRIRLDGRELHEVPTAKFAEWIKEIVKVEGPIHQDEVARRIAEAAGVQRVGARIESTFQNGIAAAARAGEVRRRGDFLWDPMMQVPPIRDRSALPAGSKKIEFISNEEIAAAIRKVVELSYGILFEAIPPAVCKLLGFARTSEDMSSVVKRIVRKLAETGAIEVEDGQITPGDSVVR